MRCRVQYSALSLGAGVYFNVGIFIKAMNVSRKMHLFYKAPLYGRLEHMLPEGDRLKALIKSAEDGKLAGDRLTELCDTLANRAIPDLLPHLQMANLPSLIRITNGNWAIRSEAHAYLKTITRKKNFVRPR
jgi:hypothetical protein